MSNISDYVIPVNDGNGIIIGDIFITAGHVADGYSYISFTIGDDFYHFSPTDAILFLQYTERTADGLFDDIAIYRLNKRYNDLSFDTSLPDIGSVLQSISIKHRSAERGNITSSQRIFDKLPIESHELITTKATVCDIKGNFIFCNMEVALEKGCSGSPLLYNNRVIGILHGGLEDDNNVPDRGKLCAFQSIGSIKSALEDNGIL